MSNFKALLNDVLIEQGKTLHELEENGIITERAFYRYSQFTPYLPSIIKIANYLKVSLDYLAGRATHNIFHKYTENQKNFYPKLMKILKDYNISQQKFSEEVLISRPNFIYWKKGKLPKFETLINIANYLNCSIDEFLD